MHLVVVAPEQSNSRSWAAVPYPAIKSIRFFTAEELADEGSRNAFLRLIRHVATRLVLVTPRQDLPDDVRRGLRSMGRRMYSLTEAYVHPGREGLVAVLDSLKITSKRGKQSVAKFGSADPGDLHAAQTMQRNYNAGVNVIFGGANPKVNTPEEAASGKRPGRRPMRPNRTATRNNRSIASTGNPLAAQPIAVQPAPAVPTRPGAFGLSRMTRPPLPSEHGTPEDEPTPELEAAMPASDAVPSEGVESAVASESAEMVPVAEPLDTPFEGGWASAASSPAETPTEAAAVDPVGEPAPEVAAEPLTPEGVPAEVSAEEPANVESAPAVTEDADADPAGGGAEEPAPEKRTPPKAAKKAAAKKAGAKKKTKKTKAH